MLPLFSRVSVNTVVVPGTTPVFRTIIGWSPKAPTLNLKLCFARNVSFQAAGSAGGLWKLSPPNLGPHAPGWVSGFVGGGAGLNPNPGTGFGTGYGGGTDGGGGGAAFPYIGLSTSGCGIHANTSIRNSMMLPLSRPVVSRECTGN